MNEPVSTEVFQRRARSIFLVSFVASVVFSAVAGTGVLFGFDYWLIEVFQRFPSRFLDAIGGIFSFLGDVEVTSVGIGLLCLALFFILRERMLAVRLVVAYGVFSVIELAMKFYLPVPPLPDSLGRTGEYDPTIDVAYLYPYPSGHMLRCVFLFGAVFVLWPNRLARALIVVFLIGVAASRVYLGVHWLTDLVGGALMGLAGVAWAFRTYRPKELGWKRRS